jgi:hypothetical protein
MQAMDTICGHRECQQYIAIFQQRIAGLFCVKAGSFSALLPQQKTANMTATYRNPEEERVHEEVPIHDHLGRYCQVGRHAEDG